jgi:hypothetical protein
MTGAGGRWKITQHMYQQMSEQQEGAAPASSEPASRMRHVPHPPVAAEHDAAPATPTPYLPVQGPGR